MTTLHKKPSLPATYGGAAWLPRTKSLAEELTAQKYWHHCGTSTEWGKLREIILHWPGEELNFSEPPDHQLMLARPDLATLRHQTESLVTLYQKEGVTVHLSDLSEQPPPNFLFQRDLFWATPQGVILGRPAALQRAGEEPFMAQVLADLKIPVIYHPHGQATFEGADALWLDPTTVLVGSGVRTNPEGVRQLRWLLESMGVTLLEVNLPQGGQHLLGVVNFADADLAVVHGGRVTSQLTGLLRERGIETLILEPDPELTDGLGMNFVTLAPRRVLMPTGCPEIKKHYRQAGIEVVEAEVGEYLKAAGGPACLTGILLRENFQ
ncbi:MAG: amidinotransferase [Proteobacteria bacterium]|nr:amidinotransferase [Pseudomonadota bacterium]MBU1686166.1 amidinotransferase [Pseudomonadota bacterium]